MSDFGPVIIGIGSSADWRDATEDECRQMGIPTHMRPVQICVRAVRCTCTPLDASEARIVAYLETCAADWRVTAQRSAGWERDRAVAKARAYDSAASHVREGRHR